MICLFRFRFLWEPASKGESTFVFTCVCAWICWLFSGVSRVYRASQYTACSEFLIPMTLFLFHLWLQLCSNISLIRFSRSWFKFFTHSPSAPLLLIFISAFSLLMVLPFVWPSIIWMESRCACLCLRACACILQQHMQLSFCESLLWAQQNIITLMNMVWLSGSPGSQICRIVDPDQVIYFTLPQR